MAKQSRLQWCPTHWADLMHTLQDHGLGDQIAPNREALNKKHSDGREDPCHEATVLIDIAAVRVFTMGKLIKGFKGCPICAFNGITQDVVSQMAIKYKQVN